MVSFASSVASQIGFLVASLNKKNLKSVGSELSQIAELYGSAGRVILLKSCLEQVDVREGKSQNSQLKLQLLRQVVGSLVTAADLESVLSQGIASISGSKAQFLQDLANAVNLPLSSQILLGLALFETNDVKWKQEGVNYLRGKLLEASEGAEPVLEAVVANKLVRLIKSSESHFGELSSLLSALPPGFLGASQSPLFTLPLQDEVNEVDSFRDFSMEASTSFSEELGAMLGDLSSATHVADVVEELGYGCTSSVQHCKSVLGQGPELSNEEIARLLGMVSRTFCGLEDAHGMHATFVSVFSNVAGTSQAEGGLPVTWDYDVLVESIRQLVPNVDWIQVMNSLDHDAFFIPDSQAFSVFMSVYKKASLEPFPIEAVCGKLWKNTDGQLSFLRHAVNAPPEVFTFAHSPRVQLPLEGLHGHKSPVGTPNHCWLSVDLIDILCQLAEAGHMVAVRAMLEHPIKQCAELLLLGLAQVKTQWNTLQSEVFSILLPLYLANNPNSSTLLHAMWPINREAVTKAMVDYHQKDPNSVSRLLDVCQDLKMLSMVLDTTPFSFAIDLAALASRREYLNLEKWLQDSLNLHRDSLFEACVKYLMDKTRVEGPSAIAQRAGSNINLSAETTAIFCKVLLANVSQIENKTLVDEMKEIHAVAVRANPRLHSAGSSEQAVPSDVEEEANSYFQRIYGGQLSIDDVVEMLKSFSKMTKMREQEIYACMIQSLFDEYRFFPKYPDRELRITGVLFGSLIKHQLVTSITLGIALRCVLDALKKPIDSKMFSFGSIALEQFTERLKEWPQYCHHILQIAHVRDGVLPLAKIVQSALESRASGSQGEGGQGLLVEQAPTTLGVVADDVSNRVLTGQDLGWLPVGHQQGQSSLSSPVIEAAGDGSSASMTGSTIPSLQQAQIPVQSISTLQHQQTILVPTLQSQRPSSPPPPLLSVLPEHVPQGSHSVDEYQEQKQTELLQALSKLPNSLQAKGQPQPAVGIAPASGSQTIFSQLPQQVGVIAPLSVSAKSEEATVATAIGLSIQPTDNKPGSQQNANGVSESFKVLPSQANGQSLPIKEALPRRNSGGPVRAAAAPFGHALNIETLVAAQERRDTPIEAPAPDVQDKIAFIINNISTANLDTKVRELAEVLMEQYYPWFAMYMVTKRASIEPNFHDLYLKFLDKLNLKALSKDVLKATYENCKVLLRSELIKTSSEERSLLKNLGSWLGKLTIGRNQALRAKEIDPKSLIIEAYEKGLMIAIVPFTSKILEPCQTSLAYQPPNPWTMGILGLLAELYAIPNLKMNLKFDIEVLFKNLGMEMKEAKPTQLLKGRQRVMEGNPDFSNKDLTLHSAVTVSPVVDIGGSASGSALAPFGDVFGIASTVSPTGHPLTPSSAAAVRPVQTQGGLIGPLRPENEEQQSTATSVPGRTVASSVTPVGPAAVSRIPSGQLSSLIPNLSSYVVYNPKLSTLNQQLQIQRIVPVAMEQAIREIIAPVVDRSVNIACMTTRELVMKDYVLEAEEGRMLKSGDLMVASLAGSLAHVTCKEPLRLSMTTYLRTLLQQQAGLAGDVLDQAVHLIINDNLDLGCAVIEKAATEKALRELEDALTSVLSQRREQRAQLGTYYEATVYSGANLARLPEALRPKPGRLSQAQQRVYEDFARLPWQNQPSTNPTTSSFSTAASPASAAVASSSANLAPIQPTAGSGGRFSVSQIAHATSAAYSTSAQSVISTSAGTGLGASGQESDVPGSGAPSLGSASFSGTSLGESGSKALTELTVGGGFSPQSESSGAEPASKAPPGISASGNAQADQSGPLVAEPSLSTGEAMEMYFATIQKLDAAVAKLGQPQLNFSLLPMDHELRVMILDIPEIIAQSISRDETAIAIAQKLFKRLYENTTSRLNVSMHLAIFGAVRDSCKRVVKEMTNWVIYSDDDRKYNREIAVGLIKSELIYLTDYNIYLAKFMDGGRNAMATEFAIHLVKTCVVQEPVVSSTEFYNVIETLAKIAQRPGAPEALQQLVELAKNAPGTLGVGGTAAVKDEKARVAKDKKVQGMRPANVKDEGKPVGKEITTADPVGLREQVVSMFFDDWIRICDHSGNNDKACAAFAQQLHNSPLFKGGDDIGDRVSRILLELAVAHCLSSDLLNAAPGIPQTPGLSFVAIDAMSKLVLYLVKSPVDQSGGGAASRHSFLNKVLNVTVRAIIRDAEEKRVAFNARPYFRLFVTWLMDFGTSADVPWDPSGFVVLGSLGSAFLALQPLRVPSFSFAWLELISHRSFMPKLLLVNGQKGWPLFQRLLISLFKFMEPYLRNAELSDPVRLLYKGTLRVLLVLLHDFPEFLCDNHFSFCDVIPPSCIQMRNLILSAFPRNMRLPDPFTPNLKVDLLPEIAQTPRILADVELILRTKGLKNELDEFLKTRQPTSFLSVDIKQHLLLSPQEVVASGTRYNVPIINALVLYVGMQGKGPTQMSAISAPVTQSAPMDIFMRLITDLDTEGRYLFLNAIANQLRYPNNHTHYFSCVILYLFAEASQEIVQEQITRVLLERLIVNRPHPWGLLITFIELIKNPRYNFWSHQFTRCAPEIEKLFESVARSCMGPPPKIGEDELPPGLGVDQLKA